MVKNPLLWHSLMSKSSIAQKPNRPSGQIVRNVQNVYTQEVPSPTVVKWSNGPVTDVATSSLKPSVCVCVWGSLDPSHCSELFNTTVIVTVVYQQIILHTCTSIFFLGRDLLKIWIRHSAEQNYTARELKLINNSESGNSSRTWICTLSDGMKHEALLSIAVKLCM